MKGSYKRKLVLNFLLVFAVFTTAILIFQLQHDKWQRRQMLGERLDATAVLVDRFLMEYPEAYEGIAGFLQESMRVTIMDHQGNVLFDNLRDDHLGNHMDRPELQIARKSASGRGDAIRYSQTLGKKYYYYAFHSATRYVRVALPYESAAKQILDTDWLYVLFIASLFAIALIALLFLSDSMGRTISRLRSFTIRAKNGDLPTSFILPSSELGDIGNEIIDAYSQLHAANAQLKLEQEKMRQHFMLAEEGVAIFDEDKQVLYANTLYIKYINLIREEAVLSAQGTCDYKEFAPLMGFRKDHIQGQKGQPHGELGASKSILVPAGSTWIEAKLLTFPDYSFEIILDDVSQVVEEKKLKREMTSNIAHELRTPVASIQGYIETLMRMPNINTEQASHFLEKAHQQGNRLSELIADITAITISEEISDNQEFQRFDLHALFDSIVAEFQPKLDELHIEVKNDLDNPFTVNGLDTLIASVIRNLIANSTRYAGSNFKIVIRQLSEDANSHFLSYYDTGKGVPLESLPRIFERFYRVDNGRARQNGGSGLGLSIVKNALAAHGSQVYARIPQGGGLEILFSLPK